MSCVGTDMPALEMSRPKGDRHVSFQTQFHGDVAPPFRPEKITGGRTRVFYSNVPAAGLRTAPLAFSRAGGWRDEIGCRAVRSGPGLRRAHSWPAGRLPGACLSQEPASPGLLLSRLGIFNEQEAWIWRIDSPLLSEGSSTGKAASGIRFSFPETSPKPVTGEIAQRRRACQRGKTRGSARDAFESNLGKVTS